MTRKIAAYGTPMSDRQRNSLLNRGKSAKPASTRSHAEIEADMAKVRDEAERTKGSNGAWSKHLLKKHDSLRLERDSLPKPVTESFKKDDYVSAEDVHGYYNSTSEDGKVHYVKPRRHSNKTIGFMANAVKHAEEPEHRKPKKRITEVNAKDVALSLLESNSKGSHETLMRARHHEEMAKDHEHYGHDESVENHQHAHELYMRAHRAYNAKSPDADRHHVAASVAGDHADDRDKLMYEMSSVEAESNREHLKRPEGAPHAGPDPKVQKELRHHGMLARVAKMRAKRGIHEAKVYGSDEWHHEVFGAARKEGVEFEHKKTHQGPRPTCTGGLTLS